MSVCGHIFVDSRWRLEAKTERHRVLCDTHSGTGGGAGATCRHWDTDFTLRMLLLLRGLALSRLPSQQVDLSLIKAAEVAINDVISQLPQQLVDEAQQFRVARARAAGKA